MTKRNLLTEEINQINYIIEKSFDVYEEKLPPFVANEISIQLQKIEIQTNL